MHVPEGKTAAYRSAFKNLFFQEFIKYAHAAVLDYQIAFRRLPQQRRTFFSIFVNNRAHIREIAGVPVLQTTVSIRFRKDDVMAERMKLLVNAAIVRGSPIPVRGRNAGTENENPHREISWQICMSCCARCAQVWRSRMVFSPFSASW